MITGDFSAAGKIMIAAGIALITAGVIILFFPKIPIGRFWGDILIRKKNFSFFSPSQQEYC